MSRADPHPEIDITTATPQELGAALLNETSKRSTCDETFCLALIRAGADLAQRDREDSTALVWASIFGRTKIVREMIAQGVNIEEDTCNNRTRALACAAGEGHMDIVKLLLRAGADVNHQINSGMTALMGATRYKKMLRLLRAAGADAALTDMNGKNVLSYVPYRSPDQYKETCQRLIQHGADIDLPAAGEHHTLLMSRAEQGSADTVTVLLDLGADISRKDFQGKTAEDLARRGGHIEVLRAFAAHHENMARQEMEAKRKAAQRKAAHEAFERKARKGFPLEAPVTPCPRPTFQPRPAPKQ